MLIAFLLLMETSFIGRRDLRSSGSHVLIYEREGFWFSSSICTSIVRPVYILEIRNMLDPLNLPEVVTMCESFQERSHNFAFFSP